MHPLRVYDSGVYRHSTRSCRKGGTPAEDNPLITAIAPPITPTSPRATMPVVTLSLQTHICTFTSKASTPDQQGLSDRDSGR